MVVAPWILPLRVAVFAVLIGDWRMLPCSALTLMAGALVTTLLSMTLGLMAQANGLQTVYAFSAEIQSRLSPTLLTWVSLWPPVPLQPTPRSTPGP